MASQQLTTMPMNNSHVEVSFACGETRKKGDIWDTDPASPNKCQTCAEHEQTVCFIPISTCVEKTGVVTEVNITEKTLNQLKNEE